MSFWVLSDIGSVSRVFFCIALFYVRLFQFKNLKRHLVPLYEAENYDRINVKQISVYTIQKHVKRVSSLIFS